MSIHSTVFFRMWSRTHDPDIEFVTHLYSYTLLFKSNGIYFSNAYLIYRASIFWSKLLIWHSSGVLWEWCEISYAYDYPLRLYDHSKSVRFKKRDIKTLATGSVFGGYFIIRDRLLWELKLFLFHGIDMKLVHKINVHVWINGWENNREAGDLRRYRAHYDVIGNMTIITVPVEQPRRLR